MPIIRNIRKKSTFEIFEIYLIQPLEQSASVSKFSHIWYYICGTLKLCPKPLLDENNFR